MPETDTIPVSASIASTGKGIRYIGDWAYAYSGNILVPNSLTELNNFTTGAGVLIGKWYPGYAEQSGDNMQFIINLNENEIYRTTLDSRLVGNPFQYINIVIPPLTAVKITCENKTSASNVTMQSNLVGRVYGDQ